MTFHTSIPPSELEVVAEFVVYDPETFVQHPVGWVSLPFSEKTAATVELLEGTPRFLFASGSKSTFCTVKTRDLEIVKKGARLEYRAAQIAISTTTKVVRKVIPENCLCGPADEVLGLETGRLPRGAEQLLNVSFDLPLAPMTKLFMNNSVIQLPPQFESRLLLSLQAMQQDDEKTKEPAVLEEYRLCVGCHNQWTFINSRRLHNSVAMVLEGNTLRSGGVLIVDNLPEGQEGAALVFQLVGIAHVGHGEKFQLLFGEHVFLPRYNAGARAYEPAAFTASMNTDPDNSVTGTEIWNPPEVLAGEDWGMLLTCEVATTAQESAAEAEHQTALTEKLEDERRKLEALRKLKDDEMRRLAQEKENEYQKRQRQLEEQDKKLTMQEEDLRRQRDEMAKSSLYRAPLGPSFSGTLLPRVEQDEPHFFRAGPQPDAFRQVAAGMGAEQPKEILERNVPGDLPKPQVQIKEEPKEVTLPPPADIDEDFASELKASVITMEFIGFKPKGLYQSCEELVPRRMCLSFRFFNFPVVNSPAVLLKRVKGYSDAPMPLQLAGEVSKWTNTFSTDPAGKSLLLQFAFDPAADKDIPAEMQHEDFLRYLARNIAKVYIFDADGMTPVGTCRIYLADFLRRNEPTKILKKEYDLRREDGQVVGALQILIQNVGTKSASELRQNQIALKPEAHKGKTKIKSKPLTLKDMTKIPQMYSKCQADPNAVHNDDYRKSEIVYAYKLYVNDTMSKYHMPQWYTDTLMEDVEKYRTVSRVLNIAAKSGRTLQRETAIPLPYGLGQMSLCPVLFANPHDQSATFSVSVTDPEGRSDFQLVTDPKEWKYFCFKNGYEQPADWLMLMDKTRFGLRKGEQVVLVFKLFCLVPPTNRQRTVQIQIKSLQSNRVVQLSEMMLKYKDTYYNGHFICNEPENSSAELQLVPDIFPRDFEKAQYAISNRPGIKPCIAGHSIRLICLTPPAPKDLDFFVFVYTDECLYETLCILQVTVRSHKCFDISGFAGTRVTQNLVLGSDEASGRDLEIFSSNTAAARVTENFARRLELPGGEHRSVPVCITPYRIGKSREYMYCKGKFLLYHIVLIDMNTGDVFQRLMIRLSTVAPKPDRELELRVSNELPTTTHFAYQNATQGQKLVEFVCSHPDIINITKPNCTLMPGDTTNVEIVVHPAPGVGRGMVLVYAIDKETAKSEVISLTLVFAPLEYNNP